MRTLLKDLFTGANGTALAAHTPNVGGPWTDAAAGWQIQTNKAKGTDAAQQATTPCGGQVVEVRLDVAGVSLAPDEYLLLALLDKDSNNILSWSLTEDAMRVDASMAIGNTVENTTVELPAAFPVRMLFQRGKSSVWVNNVLVYSGENNLANDESPAAFSMTAEHAGGVPAFTIDNLVIIGGGNPPA